MRIHHRLTEIIARARRSVAFTLFAACFFTYAYFYQGGGQNENARFDSIRAFVDNGRGSIDAWADNSTDVIELSGHVYSSKAPGTFLLGLVPYWLTDEACALFGVNPSLASHITTYLTCVATISLLGALAVVVMYWLGLRLGASAKNAAMVALALGLGTSLFPFATMFFSHVASAFCAIFAFYQFLVYRQSGRSGWSLLSAGAALSFSIALEYPAVIAAVLLVMYFHWSALKGEPKKTRAVGKLALGIALGMAPLFIYNFLVFDNPFFVTYEAYADPSSTAFTAHKAGLLGIRFPLWDWDAWPQFLANLSEITYKPLRGLFFDNPVTIAALVGFAALAVSFARERTRPAPGSPAGHAPEAALALAVLVAYLCFNASFGNSITYWGGGASFGPRHLLLSVPFLAVPMLACARLRWARIAFVCLALVSVAFCLMATAVEPRTAYAPSNPIFYFYLPRFLTGLLAVNQKGVFSNTLITSSSIAFNWGKLAGLPHSLQLVPLYAGWLLAVRRLDRQLGIRERGFTFAVGILVFVCASAPIAALF